MPIRDLAYFAKKEMKFAEVLRVGRERGNWVKTIPLDVAITTSQTDLVMDFIKKTIKNEKLQLSDIIMLKYLKRVDHNDYSLHKIFKSVDVREMQTLKYLCKDFNIKSDEESLENFENVLNNFSALPA